MKKLIALLLIGLLVITGCGRPKESTSSGDGEKKVHTLRIAYLVSEEQSTHLAAVDFKEKLEKESDGRLKVELYPNGQLYGSDREAIEAVQLGNIEMTIPALAPLASFNKKFMVFDLPFLFNNNEAAYKALDGELGQDLLKELEKNDLKGLVFGENGFRHMSNNNGPIESPEDLKGIKFRTLENPVHTDTFSSFGANASPFAFGELYTALQQKTYDAMEAPISLYYTNKFYEVQKYLTMSGHVYAATILLVNNNFYNSLPEDLQQLVTAKAEEFRDEQRQLAQKQDVEFLEKLKESGMEINELSTEQREKFREAAKAVYDKHVPSIGEDLVNKALEANK
ncbi:DctP family TRAP transporter solute-binding subunit [Bacillus sp. DTU_2020_1000418_1_SI_GHA_SEK_038]|uniref:TRAP transporter substrate-binding protein n=1 Tax=Bacillus sp. DTU_2020_1000418_1_SI_GHA_SEK_038 TaxID=3077585 RepID=UPI0028E5F3D3|nr:DctP family TRAP transporter solute-binding subunit [Bacillus sp. DTU_2020_1000418_1_SI_GHA_SEK_038]WNS75768.1 DctP family TRAP transporter solute-binding subunit [Bacillus sp. DTU_2020_1000418_1_SI_GHA_SEK_038]